VTHVPFHKDLSFHNWDRGSVSLSTPCMLVMKTTCLAIGTRLHFCGALGPSCSFGTVETYITGHHHLGFFFLFRLSQRDSRKRRSCRQVPVGHEFAIAPVYGIFFDPKSGVTCISQRSADRHSCRYQCTVTILPVNESPERRRDNFDISRISRC
jgi:hypothetical protein